MGLSVGLIAACATVLSKLFVDWLNVVSGQSSGSIKIVVMSYITMAVIAFVVGLLLDELLDYYQSWNDSNEFA